ncbi:MAG: hypothetical protein COV57_01135, partial [Candidatus Liptonbacteria bacterium CG11_big_fil_rev_8_21_14_0_20_35_14]
LRGLEIPNQAIIIDNKNTSDVKILSNPDHAETGKIKILAVPVVFSKNSLSSNLHSNTRNRINKILFSDETIFNNIYGSILSAKNFYKENSQNQIELQGDVLDPQFIDFKSESGEPCVLYKEYSKFQEKFTEKILSKNIDNIHTYDIISVFVEDICDVGGWGSVGRNYYIGGDHFIGFNTVDSSGDDISKVKIFNHELGHNLGLYHANSCEKSSIHELDNGVKRLGCQTLEYGDPFDIMGGTYQNYFFNLPHKWKLNWINEERIIQIDFEDILEDKVFTINSIDEKTSDPVGIAVNLDPTFPIHSDERYLVEYRLDKKSGSNNKVLIHRDYMTNSLPSSPSILINASNERFPMDFDLDVGESWEDRVVGIKFTVLNKTQNTTTIEISRKISDVVEKDFFKINKENIKTPLIMESGGSLSIPFITNMDTNNIIMRITNTKLNTFIDLYRLKSIIYGNNIKYEDINNLLPGNYKISFIIKESNGSAIILDSIDLNIKEPTLTISGRILGDFKILPMTINDFQPFYSS